jgi:hypothetical protein
MTCADDAKRDLAPVRNENTLHGTDWTGGRASLPFEGRGVALESDLFAVAFGPVPYGRHAGGGVSPNTGRKLLQRRAL